MTLASLPQHVAIIMDGNGRWANNRGLPRIAGHKAGLEATKKIVKHAAKKRIQVLSLFAFSSENWKRSVEEVNYLMELFFMSLEQEVDMLHQNGIQLRFIGDRMRFNLKLREKIYDVEKLTSSNTGMVLMIAVDYGGHWDICQAMQKLADEVKLGKLLSSQITPQHISAHLSFADLPDPDLFIRTSGEMRISNFMLWQIAYSELYFTKILWPDFDESQLDSALMDYSTRERRFGFIPQTPHLAHLE